MIRQGAIRLLGTAALALIAGPVLAQGGKLRAGAAKADITPTADMFPLTGGQTYGSVHDRSSLAPWCSTTAGKVALIGVDVTDLLNGDELIDARGVGRLRDPRRAGAAAGRGDRAGDQGYPQHHRQGAAVGRYRCGHLSGPAACPAGGSGHARRGLSRPGAGRDGRRVAGDDPAVAGDGQRYRDAGASAEVFTEIGEHLKRDSLFDRTMVVTVLANRVGYIPTDKAYLLPAEKALTNPLKPGCAEPAMVDAWRGMMAKYLPVWRAAK